MNEIIYNVTVDLNTGDTTDYDLGASFPDTLITETSHTLKLTLNSNGSALDVSGLSAASVTIKKNDSADAAITLTSSYAYETDGTDGKVNFTIPKDLIAASLAAYEQSPDNPQILYSVRLEDANSKIQVRKLITVKDVDGL
jgi:hypothetical protein